MRKIAIGFSVVVLTLTFLCLFGFAIYRIALGDGRLGPATEPLKAFVNFPMRVNEAFESLEISGISPTYEKKDPSFEEINNLDYDLYGINAFWDNDNYRWSIRLFNFKNDEVLYEWYVTDENFDVESSHRQFSNAEIRNCLFTEDKSLFAYNVKSNNMVRLDAQSNIVWQNQELVFHHAMNYGPDGNIWVCATDIPRGKEKDPANRYVKNLDGRISIYRDDYIVKIDPETGNILEKKGVAQILMDNGYDGLVYGTDVFHSGDPIHLNDIEPILTDGPHWQKGDLLLSLRHKSVILLYRPSTNKVLKVILGPFMNQHDVDVLSDTTIAFLNNNISTMSGRITGKVEHTDFPYDSLVASEVIIYNFEDGSFKTYLNDLLLEERVKTETEGFQQILSNGDLYVEAQNSGKMYILDENGFKMKKVFDTPVEGYVERPNWIRIFETLNFKK